MASMLGLGTGLVNIAQNRKLGKRHEELTGDVRSLSSDLESGLNALATIQNKDRARMMSGFDSIRELQMGSMFMLRTLDEKLESLSDIAWNMQNYLERKERKEDFLGDLKLTLMSFEDILDGIDETAASHLEYSTLQVEVIQSLIKRHDVKLEHFKTMSVDQIKWAKGVLERVENTHRSFIERLESE
jgi:hypothetical protein